MSRWFRHYAGMMRDEKLVSVAIRTKQPVERVVWVWGAILESAAEIDDNGTFEIDAAEIAYFLRSDEADICAIIAGLESAGRIGSGIVVKWGNRQFQSDRSKDRVAAYRERKRAENGRNQGHQTSRDGDVTLQERHCNSPETETETETETDTTSDKSEDGSARKRASSKPASRGSKIPDDWQPELTPRSQSIVDGWPPGRFERELRRFRDHAADKGRISKDWQAAFRTWIEKADDFGPPRQQNSPTPGIGRTGAGAIRDPVLAHFANASRLG